MTRRPWFMGIDLGTGSCKSAVVDPDGAVIGFDAVDYGGDTSDGTYQEQEADRLAEATVVSARGAAARAGVDPQDCAGLSLGGALHSVMAVDANDRPLTGVITWADGRAVEQARRLTGRPEGQALYRETGCPAHGMFPVHKIVWLRENRPEVFRAARRYVSAKEYVCFRLTGRWAVDVSIAAGSGFLNTHALGWSADALALAGIEADRLNPLLGPAEVLGGLLPGPASRMGLPAGVPVVIGSSDAVNSSMGAGAVAADQATCMVGTSGALRVISPRPVLDPAGRSWCYAIDDRHWLVGGAINNGGVALAWLRDCLNHVVRHRSAAPLTFDDVLALAAETAAGAGGVICLPFFAGERSPNWNLNARAAFFGMALEHGPGHLARALLEGIGFRFRSLLAVLTEVELDIRRIVASGGFTRSEVWLQATADILNRDLHVPAWGETSALAAAYWAALGAGAVESLEGIAGWVRVERVCRPDVSRAQVYDRVYALYDRTYRAVAGCFDDVARLQADLAAREEPKGG